MMPVEQYRAMLDVLRHLNQEPKHFHSAGHVPAKDRASMFGLTTIDNKSWLIGDRAVLTRRHGASSSADTPGLISTWTATDDGACYAISDAPVPSPPSRPWRPGEDSPKLVHFAAGGPPASGLPDAPCGRRDGQVCLLSWGCFHQDASCYPLRLY